MKPLTDTPTRDICRYSDPRIVWPGTRRIALKSLPPLETLTDLRHEVRWLSRELLWQARQSSDQKALCSARRPDIQRSIQTIVRRWMDAGDDRMKILCFACAAELGVPVELPTEECWETLARNGDFALRVLFWAAQRRMPRQGAMTDPE